MIGQLYKRTAYLGGDEPLEVALEKTKAHVQVGIEGATIQQATVEVMPWGHRTWRGVTQGIDPAGSDYVLVIDDFNLERIRVGGLPAGAYFVTVAQ